MTGIAVAVLTDVPRPAPLPEQRCVVKLRDPSPTVSVHVRIVAIFSRARSGEGRRRGCRGRGCPKRTGIAGDEFVAVHELSSRSRPCPSSLVVW